MDHRLLLRAIGFLVCITLPTALMAQTTYFTDFNKATAGLGTNAAFNWTTSTAGSAKGDLWNTSNVSTNTNTPVSWTNATTPNNAVFGAGTAAGATLTATLGSNISVGTVSILSDSWVVNTTSGSGANTVSNSITFNSSADSSLGSSFVIQGGGGLTKSGTSTLTISGSNTYTGGTTVSAGTLALSSASALQSGSALTLAGGTLQLSAAGTYTFGALSVTASSTIDFGGAGVTNLALSSLSISNGAQLTIQNWVRYSDQFTVSSAPTISGTSVSAGTDISRQSINFSNYGELAQWNSGSFSANNIAAVPEPSTYGAMLMAGCAGLFGLRRWRAKRRAAPGAVQVGS